MAEVHLWSGLRALAGGQSVVTVEAGNVGEMLAALVAAHPGLKAPIAAGVSVAVDGRIIASALDEKVRPDSEIYLMQRLRGG